MSRVALNSRMPALTMFAAVALCTLSAPGDAPASTASMQYETVHDDEPALRYGTARFQADPGETNRLSITETQGSVTFSDPGSRVTAGLDCVAVDAHTVRCPTGVDAVAATTNDGPDTVHVTGDPAQTDTFTFRIDGGEGDDTLSAEGAHGVLDGGAGSDTIRSSEKGMILVGGAGRDTLIGGPGPDVLDLGGSGHLDTDMADGGGGRDTVSYANRTSSVTVRLDRDTGSEGDRLTDIENITGGRASDILVGDAGPNVISAAAAFEPGATPRPRNDWLQGGPGDDVIHGSLGRNQLRGEGGNDQLEVAPGNLVSGGAGNDVLSDLGQRTDCGSGLDRVSILDVAGDAQKEAQRRLAARRSARPGAGCERPASLDVELAGAPRRQGQSVTVSSRRVPDDLGSGCFRVDVRRRSDGVSIGSAITTLHARSFRRARIRLIRPAGLRAELVVLMRWVRDVCADRTPPRFGSSAISVFGVPRPRSKASRVRVHFRCGVEQAAPRNTHPLTCSGSRATLDGLRWRNWGEATATASGTLYYAPAYAGSGGGREYRVKVTLSNRRPCPGRPGFLYYRTMRLEIPSRPRLVTAEGTPWKVPQPPCPVPGRSAPI